MDRSPTGRSSSPSQEAVRWVIAVGGIILVGLLAAMGCAGQPTVASQGNKANPAPTGTIANTLNRALATGFATTPTAPARPSPLQTNTPVLAPPPASNTPELAQLPTHTPTPSQAPVNSPPLPTATPLQCQVAIDSHFSRLWTTISYVQQVTKCPTGPGLRVSAAQQYFQNGLMLWRQDKNAVYVMPYSLPAQYFDAQRDPDAIYREGEPESGDNTPPSPGLMEPIRGFGKVWRLRLGGPEAKIGWAIEKERGFTATIQEFQGATLFENDKGIKYLISNNEVAWVEFSGY